MIERTFSISDVADLDISIPSGSLFIDSGSPGTVEVTVDTKDPDGWRIEQTGNSVFVGYERGLIGGGGRARVRVVAPEGSALKARSGSADIRVAIDLDRTSINSASGDVHLQDIGSGSIKTASGDVNLGHVDDDLTVRSASGDIRAESVNGSMALTTASGDVFVERADGPISVSSASGDLRVATYTGEDLEAATMSGDVYVGIPAGRVVKLRATTLSGSVRLPERKTAEVPSGPTVSIGLKSVSGDITINRVD